MRATRQEGLGEECRVALHLWFATVRFATILNFSRNCGEGEIRTPETLAGLPLFESGAFNHSATSPFGNLVIGRWLLVTKIPHFAIYSKDVTVFPRPYRLTVRTRPFQGCNRGSIPRRATIKIYISYDVNIALFKVSL